VGERVLFGIGIQFVGIRGIQVAEHRDSVGLRIPKQRGGFRVGVFFPSKLQHLTELFESVRGIAVL
jgi:hypothetical protein